MREKIIQKLDAEYELFFLETMRNSKANLFARSLEIEMKKEVQRFLREFVKSNEALDDERFASQLYLADNLMDECYRFVMDYPKQELEKNCETYLFQIAAAKQKERA